MALLNSTYVLINWERILRYSYSQSLKILTLKDLEISLIILLISTCLAFKSKKYRNCSFRYRICLASLFPYFYLTYAITVLGRTGIKTEQVELLPFWSLLAALTEGRTILFVECILNVVLFIPIGFLLCGIDLSFKKSVLIGVVLSYSIELSQLILHRGLFELFDDPINNVLGCVIGYGIMHFLNKNISF